MSKNLIPEADHGQNVPVIPAIVSSVVHHRSYMLVPLLLAVLATMTSVGIAVMSGLQRAIGVSAQVACVALAVAAVVGTHLLPALSRGKSMIVRCCAVALYVASLLVVFYGQVFFFLNTQRTAGERRADAVAVVGPRVNAAPSRPLLAIAADEEKVRTTLAIIDARSCGSDCSARNKRHGVLEARLGMLTTEDEEARRREVQDDRRATSAERQRDSVRVDPATSRLARMTGTDEQTLNLLLALVSAAVLDFLGGFCWYLAFDRSRNSAVVQANRAVALNDWSRREHMDEVADGSTPDFSTPVTGEAENRLTQLVHDVAAGRVRPTVDGIREHFNCAQKTANQLRREYIALCQAIQSAVSQS